MPLSGIWIQRTTLTYNGNTGTNHPSSTNHNYSLATNYPGRTKYNCSPGTHTVPVVPTRTIARKAVTLPVYKEGKCATTHIHRFVNDLALNGETDELIKIALFGNSLTDANNYNWFTTQHTTYPYQDFKELLTAFKLRYQEVDYDDQAYLKFRSLKQEAKESIDDYYERMMKLANQFATIPSDNFLMSNFRAGILKYL